ncbi:3-ketoacyl-CoA thiolase, peroxisomal [Hypsizygus marmoreus]|uniref:3-ketoacyl-CoA thiolase, peroxisomal n=1 Tax=Hypsizygus marmoreus TaxID=39966 RepID=A0A369JAG4_HYPMA|nr:3-ketoacyl-CoA thiolase, peroxisomal [Hypsizygus marmoreus]
MSTSQSTSSARARILEKHDNDVVIVYAVRTAITKARKGGFKDTKPELLLSHVLRAVYTQPGLDPALIEDISVGNVLPAGGGASAARMASLHAGIPVPTSIHTVNRQCSSGLTAVNDIANQILAGQIDIGIGAGVESMTFGYGPKGVASDYDEEVLSNPLAEDCLIPMGFTSENVASDFNISRGDQDAFAAASFQKASAASKAGKFRAEILPVKAKVIDPKTEEVKEVLVDHDDGIREGVTAESLGKLKPAFSKTGSTHAGNASQVSDGAAAVLLARRSVAKRLGLPIVGKFVGAATIGVPPRIMGVGPAYAIPRVLEKTGLSKSDIDFFEINEAFASQALYSIRTLGLPLEKVNVHGGAIAFGHPLGCTGARQIATGLNISKQYGAKVFVTSMCIGSGMGMAGVFVSEQ